jgi:prepilin-type N-terminal cleavage/methylation domain-containing protein
MNNRGFSYIELLISLAVTGILVGMAAFHFSNQTEHVHLSHASRSLVSDLRWARQMAVSHGEEIRLILDPGLDRYWIERASYPGIAIGTVRDFKDGSQGYGETDLVGSSNGNMIRFFPKGTTNTWTTITLQNDNGKQRRITLLPTGRVRLYAENSRN